MFNQLLPHLQFIVIDTIGAREVSGRDVRDHMKKRKARKSGAAFYQLMARMEESGLVKGRYVMLDIDGNTVRERRYKVTGHGLKLYHQTKLFYMEAHGLEGGLQGA